MSRVEQGCIERHLALNLEQITGQQQPSPRVLQIEYGVASTLDWPGSEEFLELQLRTQNSRVGDHAAASGSVDMLITKVSRDSRPLTCPHRKVLVSG